MEQAEYFEKQEKYMDVNDTPYVRMLIEEVVECAQLTKEDQVLEIGCGAGRFSIPLLNRGFSLECVDLSDKLLAKLASCTTAEMKIAINCGDFGNHPGRLTLFDKVVGFYVLHHLENLAGDLGRVALCLKKGGRIVFVEPNPFHLLYYFQIAFSKTMEWKAEKGILLMTRGNICRILKANGFCDISVKTFGLLPPFAINTRLGTCLEKCAKKLWIPFRPYLLISACRL